MSFVDFVQGNNDVELRLKYLMAALVLFTLARHSTDNIRIGHVSVAVMIGLVCYYLYANETSVETTFATETLRKLRDVDPTEQYRFLYIDLNLLDVLHAALPMQHRNPQAFVTLISSTNEILRREMLFSDPTERTVDDPNGVLEVTERYIAEGVGAMHSLIHTLPQEVRAYYTLYQTCLDDYRVMMLNHERRIYDLVRQAVRAKAIDVATPPLKKFGKPKPYSKDDDTDEVVYFFRK